MRFFADGPSIPDELLTARDQDRVVFFCGAGVSRAKAKLPDFFGLARQVTKTLGVPAGAPAMKLLAEAEEIGTRLDIGGLIPADRVFGLLERDFLTRDIYRAVANALTPQNNPDLSAHKLLLRLATTRQGTLRIVTTNFDHLFNECQPEVQAYYPPHLPDLSRDKDFNGVIYLHGKINDTGDGAEGGEFVLSSSEFGRAYLSEGWATSFVKEILSKYLVVFVGYSADDPPVQYLLEALNGSTGSMGGVYAFQSGAHDDAAAKWRHKGVTAIPYSEVNAHKALWETLEAWAIRADDPTKWVDSIIGMARSGPENLQPFERGQVAHVVSTVEGARKFGEGDSLPPATWLCVFDPSCRYGLPGKVCNFWEDGPTVDPFDLYSLDSDPIPDKISPDEYSPKRDVPSGAWDAFALTKQDKWEDQSTANDSQRRGNWFRRESCLSDRQIKLGIWLSHVANQPACVWWAVRQSWLHPSICRVVNLQISKYKTEINPAVRSAWRYLIDKWYECRIWGNSEWYSLQSNINTYGWDDISLRRFSALAKPYIGVSRDLGNRAVPQFSSDCQLNSLVSIEVKYPELPRLNEIPQNYLSRLVIALRHVLEEALELENENGGYLGIQCPITKDTSRGGEFSGRSRGLPAWLLYYIKHLEILISTDIATARSECLKWPNDPDLFARLRVWALGKPELVSDEQFEDALDALSTEVFWNELHARDLLMSLRLRWPGLGAQTREKVEQKIIAGPEKWEIECDEVYYPRCAWEILNRLHWFQQQRLTLQCNLYTITNELKKKVPEWDPQFASDAAQSREIVVRSITKDTEYSALIVEPLCHLLSKAQEMRKFRDGFTRPDPFAGLAQDRPVRAFAALRLAAKKGDFPTWAWCAFLEAEQRKSDKAKFTVFVAEQIYGYSDSQVASIVFYVTIWFRNVAHSLAENNRNNFLRLASKLIAALSLQTIESRTAIIRGSKNADWSLEAINSPTGKLAEGLLSDFSIRNLKPTQGLPNDWQSLAEKTLSLPGDLHRHALVIFSQQLSMFFQVDPGWTKANLLSFLASKDIQDQEALWAGILSGGKLSGHDIFIFLKPYMLRLVNAGVLKTHSEWAALADLLLSAWALKEGSTGEKWVTNEELRDSLLNFNDEIRSHVLWQAGSWTKEKREEWVPLLLELLHNVWPKQLVAKSEVVSKRLFDLAFVDKGIFPELAEAALPLLTEISDQYYLFAILQPPCVEIVSGYPLETLSLICAVLPKDVANWPYNTDEMLKILDNAGESVRNDARLIEIKRKWDSR